MSEYKIKVPAEGASVGGGIVFSKRYNCTAWQFIIYPESAPADWRENLTQLGLPFAVSPLHDKDVNESAEGGPELKKEHYHMLMVWNNPTTWLNAIRIAEAIHSPLPLPVLNIRNRYDYFIHKNDPHKYQYDPADIELHNGFDIGQVQKLTGSEVFNIMTELTNICRDLGITEYCDLIFYCIDNGLMQHLDVAQHHTIYFTSICKGIWRTSDKRQRYAVDVRTGELVERDTLPKELQGGDVADE